MEGEVYHPTDLGRRLLHYTTHKLPLFQSATDEGWSPPHCMRCL
jgi:hypothetical protein